jgi:hypothetical protein
MASVRATTPMFKLVPGGYVFRGPRQWVFWPKRFYLVNETQRAELLSIIARYSLSRMRGRIFLVALIGLVFSATTVVHYASGHSEPTPLDAGVLFGLLPFCLYGAWVITIWPIARRLKPVLAGLPPHPPVSILDWGKPFLGPNPSSSTKPGTSDSTT